MIDANEFVHCTPCNVLDSCPEGCLKMQDQKTMDQKKISNGRWKIYDEKMTDKITVENAGLQMATTSEYFVGTRNMSIRKHNNIILLNSEIL